MNRARPVNVRDIHIEENVYRGPGEANRRVGLENDAWMILRTTCPVRWKEMETQGRGSRRFEANCPGGEGSPRAVAPIKKNKKIRNAEILSLL